MLNAVEGKLRQRCGTGVRRAGGSDASTDRL